MFRSKKLSRKYVKEAHIAYLDGGKYDPIRRKYVSGFNRSHQIGDVLRFEDGTEGILVQREPTLVFLENNWTSRMRFYWNEIKDYIHRIRGHVPKRTESAVFSITLGGIGLFVDKHYSRRSVPMKRTKPS